MKAMATEEITVIQEEGAGQAEHNDMTTCNLHILFWEQGDQLTCLPYCNNN